MHGNQLAHALGCRRARIDRSLDRADVAAHHHGNEAAANMNLTDQGNVRRLYHGVGCLYGRNQTLGFNHA